MAIKRTIHEVCDRCGQVQARVRADGSIVLVGHNCSKPVPGPPDVPRIYRACDVIYVPAETAGVCLVTGKNYQTA